MDKCITSNANSGEKYKSVSARRHQTKYLLVSVLELDRKLLGLNLEEFITQHRKFLIINYKS